MEEEICQHCEKVIVFGIPEPTLIQMKYKKYHPLRKEPLWYHKHSGKAACDMTFAKPLVTHKTDSKYQYRGNLVMP